MAMRLLKKTISNSRLCARGLNIVEGLAKAAARRVYGKKAEQVIEL